MIVIYQGISQSWNQIPKFTLIIYSIFPTDQRRTMNQTKLLNCTLSTINNQMKGNRIMQTGKQLFIINLLLHVANCQIGWSDYSDIQPGRITIYSGPNMISAPGSTTTQLRPHSLPTSVAPIGSAIGFNRLQFPSTYDFCIYTSKGINNTHFSLSCTLQCNTAMYQLTVDYIVMIQHHSVYTLTSNLYYPTRMNMGLGYRSDNDIIYKNIYIQPLFSSYFLNSVVVLQGFGITNPTGTMTHLQAVVNIPSRGTINTTFITSNSALISFVQYSILFFDQSQADISTLLIFQLGTVQLTTDPTIAQTFFNSIRGRYISINRVFFGIAAFNFTQNYDKKFTIDTNTPGSLYSSYLLQNFTSLKLTYYYFAVRNCGAGQFFYKDWNNPDNDVCVLDCAPYPYRPSNDTGNSQCLPCDPSCLTCASTAPSDCLTCNSSHHRSLAGTTPSACNCWIGYVPNPIGSGGCLPCSSFMTGCNTCSSTSTCTSCLNLFSGTNTCTCLGYNILNGFCNYDYGCTKVSIINNTQTCTSCDSALYLQLNANFLCSCTTGTTTLSNATCQPTCGDNYVMTVQACDDGNLIDGDGCSSTCIVETYWQCTGTLSQGSTCKILNASTISYVGTMREVSSNRAHLYYTLTPYFLQYHKVALKDLISTTLPNYNCQVQYKQQYNMIVVTIDYTQHIQNTQHTMQILLNNSQYFWHPTNIPTTTLTGVNAELTYDEDLWMYNILRWVILVLVLISLVVFIVSIFFEKWIGLQLIQTYQSIYFLLSLAQGIPYQFSALTDSLKWSNGYQFYTCPYQTQYTLPSNWLALSKQKQFLSNYNLTFLLIFLIAIALIVIGAVKKRYQWKLEQAISNKIKKKIYKVNKVFSFIFSRIFMMLIFFSMFEIIFSFFIQLSNYYAIQYIFPDQLNIAAAILAFIIVFSMASFLLYWFLLLPSPQHEQQEFMNLKFQNMKPAYPIAYILYQIMFILTISILNAQHFTLYLLIALQVLYLVLIILVRPYNTCRLFNKFVHNLTIIFNQLTILIATIIIILWNQDYSTPEQPNTHTSTTIYLFLILTLLVLAIVLAITRILIFNRDINFKCCKKEEENEKESVFQQDQNTMRKMEQEHFGDLLAINKGDKQIDTLILSSRERKVTNQELRLRQDTHPKIKKTSTLDDGQVNETYLNQFLNEEYVHWNNSKIEPLNKPKVSHSHIRKTTSKKTAQFKKSSLEIYMELQQKRKQQGGRLTEVQEDSN